MVLAATRSPIEIVLWAGGLIVLVIGLGLVILALRRAMLNKGSGGPVEAGLFDALREMRDTGAITREEYDAARRKMVARATGGDGGPVGVESAGVKRVGGERGPPPRGAGEIRARPGFDLTGQPLPRGESPPGNKE